MIIQGTDQHNQVEDLARFYPTPREHRWASDQCPCRSECSEIKLNTPTQSQGENKKDDRYKYAGQTRA